ncbi:hypothetical protein [Solilutibacter pythonis]|uniref:hypothetical protein n=1 Tax=Solilutibacter pythonis TaxID=2483112 RepID=UPI0011C3FA5D|nr:hypothetical protein [Lysobacter pythonis]
MKHLSCVAIIMMMAGCASITKGTTQSIRFDTVRPDGVAVEGAECTATNGKRATTFRSGLEVRIRRDKSDLNIECKSAGLPDAEGRLVSNLNYAGLGNILIGGLVGMAVDAGTGANHSYPAWVRLVFGEYRSFDRRNDETRKPMLGVLVGGVQPNVVAQADPGLPEVATTAPAQVPAAASGSNSAPTTVGTEESNRKSSAGQEAPTLVPVPSAVPFRNWRNWKPD